MQTTTSVTSSDQRIINALMEERDMIDRKIAALKKRRDHVDTMIAIARVRTRKPFTPVGKLTPQGLRLISGGRAKAFAPMTECSDSA